MKKVVWANKSNGQLCVTIPKDSGVKEGDIVAIEKEKIKTIVYSSVTGMISDTVGTIAGNTIGKIPVGGGKNLTDVYKGFTEWVGKTMDNLRMKAGLPTKNITPTTAMEDATKLGEEVANLQDMAPKLGDTSDMINIKMSKTIN